MPSLQLLEGPLWGLFYWKPWVTSACLLKERQVAGAVVPPNQHSAHPRLFGVGWTITLDDAPPP